MELEQLAEVIRNLSPTVPLNRAMWSAVDVGSYLRVSPRTVVDHYKNLPGFPKYRQMPSKGTNGALRWKASEIISWMESRV